jgi:predicted ATPase
MARQTSNGASQPATSNEGITLLTVDGFKSIVQEQSIEVRPLTILAGTNSSGKSSFMQPLLLLKQTLEAPYDPGALLLNGPNVRFTSADQLLSRLSDGTTVDAFHVGIESGPDMTVTTYFTKSKNKGLDVQETVYGYENKSYRLYQGITQDEIQNAFSATFNHTVTSTPDTQKLTSHFVLGQNRCFLTLVTQFDMGFELSNPFYSEYILESYIRRLIHLPGLRGAPDRTYPRAAIGSSFPGTFENYIASFIEQWQAYDDKEKLAMVNRDLARLALTESVVARTIDDTQVELLVNRLPRGNKNSNEDMVSIADVGLGVSQALPVVVALHAAHPGQLVYLEQPEIHLHPRAQSALAGVLADAAIQGKRLVVETHSSLLLLGIQTLVAEGKLPPELVKLHWFSLQEDGSTRIISADLDETGAFGDWPEDFATVTLESENRYLDAAQARMEGN